MYKSPFTNRAPGNYDPNTASDESALKCEDKTKTKQSFKEECDINTIVKRFGLTGELPTDIKAPQYGDFTGLHDYHEALNAIAEANEAFDAMPADVRFRFANNPGNFVDFCSDENNRAEAEKLGLTLPKIPVTIPTSAIPPTTKETPNGTSNPTPGT
jgi:phage internal scaffolding protein